MMNYYYFFFSERFQHGSVINTEMRNTQVLDHFATKNNNNKIILLIIASVSIQNKSRHKYILGFLFVIVCYCIY